MRTYKRTVNHVVDLSEANETQTRPSRLRDSRKLGRQNPSRVFQRLDALFDAGATPEEFDELFVECDVCSKRTTRSSFRFHDCEVEDSTDEGELTEELTDEEEV